MVERWLHYLTDDQQQLQPGNYVEGAVTK